MTKQRKAQVLTAVVISAALGIVFWKSSGRSVAEIVPAVADRAADPTPQDVIYAMLDAARDGNVSAYLDAFVGPMAISLRQAVNEQGEPAFSGYLRQTNAAVKGVAITEPERLSDAEVRARVEYVYADRNETQVMYLEKQPDARWRITRLDAAERIKTLVPYGTPVR